MNQEIPFVFEKLRLYDPNGINSHRSLKKSY